MKKWFFEEYKDKGGIGSEQTFDSKEEALKFAKEEWDYICDADKKAYINDSAGRFYVGLTEVDEDGVPVGDPIEIVWDALGKWV